jgi:hypothetical protein
MAEQARRVLRLIDDHRPQMPAQKAIPFLHRLPGFAWEVQ